MLESVGSVMSTAAFIFLFQILTLVGCLLTAVKLYVTGLYRRYPMFFLLFVFQIPNTIWPLFIEGRSDAYAYVWSATEPLTWLLYVLVVLELYRLVLNKHKGLYSLGRWMMYLAIVVAVAISILSLIPHFSPATPQHTRLLRYIYAVDRGVSSSLAIFILLILLFLSRYPVHLSRNVLTHTALYSVYFLSGILGMLLSAIVGLHIYDSVNVLLTGITSVCTFAWFFLLTTKGEEVETTIPIFGPDYERRALQQLEALNATLMKASRN